jgi:hypothetical protein
VGPDHGLLLSQVDAIHAMGVGKGKGVVGISTGTSGVVGQGATFGVRGEGGQVGVRGRGMVHGVLGASIHAGGAGVVGVTDGTDSPPTTGNVGVFGYSDFGMGVVGQVSQQAGNNPVVRGQGHQGPGVHGVSTANRGGVFETLSGPASGTQPTAQIQLVPRGQVEQAGQDPALPKDGQAGDLLVTIDSRDTCRLWFCQRGAEQNGPAAEWREVSLGQLIVGTA